jgi:hypothetical protein
VRRVVSEDGRASGLGALAGGGGVAVSRLTLVSPAVSVDATVPALESRMGAAAGTAALAVSTARAESERPPPSLGRHATAPSTIMLTYIL